jgi:glycolate oxidase iron-sulfur subunit
VSAPARPGSLLGTPLAEASAALDLCVHCGFCLSACPTYLTLDDENDSPRGRLVLMRAALDGELEAQNSVLREHIGRCLGCRACETACPSGVPFGLLLEATRATIDGERPPKLVARLLLAIVANDAARKLVMALLRLVRLLRLARLGALLPGQLGMALAMLEATRPALAPNRYSPRGTSGPRVALLKGCVMEGLFADTNRATERVLVRNGYQLVEAEGQGCCGALHAHAGALARARVLARRNIAAFERSGADFVTSNAAGCGAMLKEYALLLRDDLDWGARATAFSSRVRDVTELLAAAGPQRARPLGFSAAYDAPCHLRHAQRVEDPPLSVLKAALGERFVVLPSSDECCGGAGIYNLQQPQIAAAVLARKLADIAAAGTRFVATANPGCQMQIGAGLLRSRSPQRCVHLVDLLDAAYSTSPPDLAASETRRPSGGAASQRLT